MSRIHEDNDYDMFHDDLEKLLGDAPSNLLWFSLSIFLFLIGIVVGFSTSDAESFSQGATYLFGFGMGLLTMAIVFQGLMMLLKALFSRD